MVKTAPFPEKQALGAEKVPFRPACRPPQTALESTISVPDAQRGGFFEIVEIERDLTGSVELWKEKRRSGPHQNEVCGSRL
jgi:hypothetical protein